MKTTNELRQEIAALQDHITPLARKLVQLQEELRAAESREFIRVNRITRAEVEFPDGEGKPWFWTIHEFARWLRTHGITKRWAVWNGVIYHMADLLANHWPDMPGRAQDLPQDLPGDGESV